MSAKRVEEVLASAEQATRRHSLRAWCEAADRVLDAQRHRQIELIDSVRAIAALLPDDREDDAPQSFFESNGFLREGILRPLIDWLSLTSPKRARVQPKHGARYENEIAALRAFFGNERKESSNTARAIERFRLGVVDLSGGRVGMRTPVIDPYLSAVGRALAEIEDRELLYLTYVEIETGRFTVEFGKPGNRKRRIVRAGSQKICEAEGEEVVGDAMPSRSAMQVAKAIDTDADTRGGLPLGSRLAAEHVTPSLLVAESLGLLCHPRFPDRLVDAHVQQKIAAQVAKRTTLARRQLRRLLQAVTLDIAPTFVIPPPVPPTEAELFALAKRRSPKVHVNCCAGVIMYRDGLRLPCEWCLVPGPEARHPSSAWPLCSQCGKPTLPKRAVSKGGA